MNLRSYWIVTKKFHTSMRGGGRLYLHSMFCKLKITTFWLPDFRNWDNWLSELRLPFMVVLNFIFHVDIKATHYYSSCRNGDYQGSSTKRKTNKTQSETINSYACMWMTMLLMVMRKSPLGPSELPHLKVQRKK